MSRRLLISLFSIMALGLGREAGVLAASVLTVLVWRIWIERERVYKLDWLTGNGDSDNPNSSGSGVAVGFGASLGADVFVG